MIRGLLAVSFMIPVGLLAAGAGSNSAEVMGNGTGSTQNTDYAVSVVGLVPCGAGERGFIFCMVQSNRSVATTHSIEPGLPVGWSTNLSLRLITDTNGERTLVDPIGWRRRFTASAADGVFEAPGEFVLTEAAHGATMTDPDGRLWTLDRKGFVISRKETDGTVIFVDRDAHTNRIVSITIARPTGSGAPVARFRGRRFPQRPRTGFTTWEAPPGRRLGYLVSSPSPLVPEVTELPTVEQIVIETDAAGRWASVWDDRGRRWRFEYENQALIRITGSGLTEPDRIPGEVRARYASDGTVYAFVAKNLVSWHWVDSPASAGQSPVRGGASSAGSVVQPPIYSPLCPPGYELCASSLYPWSGCVGRPPNYLRWSVGLVDYRGTLCARLNWRHLPPALSCTPGDTMTNTYTYQYSERVHFNWSMGIDDILSWQAGIETTDTISTSVELTSGCCDWMEGGRRYQTCWVPLYHDVYPHELRYSWKWRWSSNWSTPSTMVRSWLGTSVARLRCCNKCCPAQGL